MRQNAYSLWGSLVAHAGTTGFTPGLNAHLGLEELRGEAKFHLPAKVGALGDCFTPLAEVGMLRDHGSVRSGRDPPLPPCQCQCGPDERAPGFSPSPLATWLWVVMWCLVTQMVCLPLGATQGAQVPRADPQLCTRQTVGAQSLQGPLLPFLAAKAQSGTCGPRVSTSPCRKPGEKYRKRELRVDTPAAVDSP